MSKNTIAIDNFSNEKKESLGEIILTYEVFGRPISPDEKVVLVVHALTGNSDVSGEEGWWSDSIGPGKPVDTNHYSVLAIDFPGNIYDTANDYDTLSKLSARDIAQLFLLGIRKLDIKQLYATVGVSTGGGIIWEMAALDPNFTQILMPFVAHWKASNWIIGCCKIQDQILENSKKPIHDARMLAMFFFRTPWAINKKFEDDKGCNKIQSDGLFHVESWLLHHGRKLTDRFSINAYLLMNNYAKTTDITRGRGSFKEVIADLNCKVVMIPVDKDFYFVPEDNQECLKELKELGKEAYYHEIKSIDGHDGFFIETEQVNKILKNYF